MKKQSNKFVQFFFSVVVLFVALSCQKNMKGDFPGGGPKGGTDVAPKDLKNFVQVNLVADNTSYGSQYVDPTLVDARRVVFSPEGSLFVSAGGMGMSNIYNYDGKTIASAITIPGPDGKTPGRPTGQVFNPTSDFKLPNGNPAQFIFATADGTISGWNSGSSAVTMIDRSSNASFSGIAMMNDGADFFLYIVDFVQNKIDVYDKNWNPVSKPFIDPDLPTGYSAYNIEALGDGQLYVMYAKKDASGNKETGPGFGYINVFNPNGTLSKRFATKGKLNAPSDITKAPGGFWGEWSQIPNLILVANSGDGHISVFDESGNYLGPLSTKGKAIEIDGLSGITFPPINGLNRYYMYFAAGPNGGSGGLVGYIKTQFLN
ncbi:MAG TPA: TIGR03118 family protein [Chitinophagaceae bacterium]|nr:TIGR03118 family protein [Chitinophagaceae bacterium]